MTSKWQQNQFVLLTYNKQLVDKVWIPHENKKKNVSVLPTVRPVLGLHVFDLDLRLQGHIGDL